MAEAKKSSISGIDPMFVTPIIVMVVLFILVTFLYNKNILGTPQNDQNILEGANNSEQSFFDIYRIIGTGEFESGKAIINTKEVTVRNAPAGSIIGNQDKLNVGVVRTGPIDSYGANWVRVDYDVAPSGWINQSDITTRIGYVRAVNILPITYKFIQPIGYGLILLLLIFAGYFKILNIREDKITAKKIELKEEFARPSPQTIKQQIEAKPDVEEIPGFQTEEIIPIEVLEQQNRWKHIKDLISSYNQNDWRQSIIEADIILEEMLDKMGYQGVTIGDKLKTVERSDFITLDKAWSAHKVRNQIAHDGSSFKLSRDLAEKTITEYEEVFREFYYV